MSLEEVVAPLVYVVDDERVISYTLGLILERNGYRAASFTDPFALLDAAKETVPQVVVSDLAMPEMNGLQLAERLRLEHPRCKVLLFSGQAQTSELLLEAQANRGVQVVLPKPLHPDTLLRYVGSLLA